jgi:hypothetical protein
MKLSWLRHLVSVFMIVAALTGATSGFAAPSAHSCAGMTAMDDCPDRHSDPTAIPRHCDSLLCGAIQLAPSFSVAPAVTAAVDFVPQSFDETLRRGLSGSPDLRPPIS